MLALLGELMTGCGETLFCSFALFGQKDYTYAPLHYGSPKYVYFDKKTLTQKPVSVK
jgi:hypothetical protein